MKVIEQNMKIRGFKFIQGGQPFYYAFAPQDGRIFKISSVAYLVLEWFNTHPLDSALPALLDFIHKHSTQKITLDEIETLTAEIQTMHAGDTALQKPDFTAVKHQVWQINAISLLVDQTCNLHCTYCYAGDGTYGNAGKMDPATALQVVDKYTNPDHTVHLSFFGGEPLLNFKLIATTVVHCQQLQQSKKGLFTFSVTTNGVLLKGEIAKFLVDHNFSIICSIDGPQAVHDPVRPFAKKPHQPAMGSFDYIFNNITTLAQQPGSPANVTLRGTVTPDSIAFLADIFDFFLNQTPFDFSLHPQMGGINQKSWTSPLVSAYDQALNAFIDPLIATNQFTAIFRFAPVASLIRQLHAGDLNYAFCGAGRNYIAISIDGNIFPCHRFNDNTLFNIGHIQKPQLNEIKRQAFTHNIAQERTSNCSKCWMLNICGGGCYSDNHIYAKDLAKPYIYACKFYESHLMAAIKVYCFLHEKRPDFMDKIGPNEIDFIYA